MIRASAGPLRVSERTVKPLLTSYKCMPLVKELGKKATLLL